MSARGKRLNGKGNWFKPNPTKSESSHSAYFTAGPPNKHIRPQSAFPSKKSTAGDVSADDLLELKDERPNTAPNSKTNRLDIPVTPTRRSSLSQNKELKKSHLKPVPKVETQDGNSNIFFDFTVNSNFKTKKRNSHVIFPFNQHDDNENPLSLDCPKEAWSNDITKVIISPPEAPPPLAKLSKQQSFEAWLSGPEVDSDEYDTDLEDDFPKSGPEKPIDPTGKYLYLEECQKIGVLPVSYISRHLSDRHLTMRHHYLGGKRTLPIAEALKNNTVTETLDLTDNYIEGQGAFCLADMFNTNFFIVSLNLSNNFLKSEGAKAMAEMLVTNTTLKSLSLSGNQLTDMDCLLFVEALKTNTTLTCLDLSHNDIGELGGSWLAAALGVNEGLIELDMSWNSLRQKAANGFGSALLKNCYLEVLDLSWNGLGEHGAAGLAKGIKGNSKLKVLDLSNNRLDFKAVASFCPALKKNNSLENLVLNLNPITEAGLELLLKTLLVHPTLRFLSVEEVIVTRSIFHKMQEVQEKKNVIIIHGDLGGYKRFTAHGSVIKLFQRFLDDNSSLLEMTLRSQDKGREGVVSIEELKTAFREAGLRLTNKQLDLLLNEGSLLQNGFVTYGAFFDGSIFKQ